MNSAEQFEALVAAHYESLFRFAMSLARVEADAWDLTQHTFNTWVAKGHQLHDQSKVKSWLFTTLHRAFLASRRRQSRFSFHTLESVAEQLPAVSPEFGAQADSAEALSAMAKIDEVYQAAVALFYLEDCSYREIALILEVPVGTVKSRIARGISQIRGILGCEEPKANSVRPRPLATKVPTSTQPLLRRLGEKIRPALPPRLQGRAAILEPNVGSGRGTSAFNSKP